MDDEVKGYRALASQDIPTAPLVGWGSLADGRSFTIFLDLSGYAPADKLIERGVPFDRLMAPTAALAARLHGSRRAPCMSAANPDDAQRLRAHAPSMVVACHHPLCCCHSADDGIGRRAGTRCNSGSAHWAESHSL